MKTPHTRHSSINQSSNVPSKDSADKTVNKIIILCSLLKSKAETLFFFSKVPSSVTKENEVALKASSD